MRHGVGRRATAFVAMPLPGTECSSAPGGNGTRLAEGPLMPNDDHAKSRDSSSASVSTRTQCTRLSR